MNIKEIIQSQYWAALEMLRIAIESCPDDLWYDATYQNRFWETAYHAIYYVHLYLQSSNEVFVPWEKAREGSNYWENPDEPYSKAEIIEYLGICQEQVEMMVPRMDLEALPGFDWLPLLRNNLELQFYSIRHVQHHTGELFERLGSKIRVEDPWVDARPR